MAVGGAKRRKQAVVKGEEIGAGMETKIKVRRTT